VTILLNIASNLSKIALHHQALIHLSRMVIVEPITAMALSAATKIKFPPAGDRKPWNAVDKALSVTLPILFTRAHMDTSSTSSLASELSFILFSTLLDQFG